MPIYTPMFVGGMGGLRVHRYALGELGMLNTHGCSFKGQNAQPVIPQQAGSGCG